MSEYEDTSVPAGPTCHHGKVAFTHCAFVDCANSYRHCRAGNCPQHYDALVRLGIIKVEQ